MTSAPCTFDDTAIRAVLTEQLSEQRAVLHSYRAALRDLHEDDADDQMYTVASHHRTLETIGEIEDALARLDAGTYGVCERCERTIAVARLEALPTAANCVECAAMPPRLR